MSKEHGTDRGAFHWWRLLRESTPPGFRRRVLMLCCAVVYWSIVAMLDRHLAAALERGGYPRGIVSILLPVAYIGNFVILYRWGCRLAGRNRQGPQEVNKSEGEQK